MNKQSKILTAVIIALGLIIAVLGQRLYITNDELNNTQKTLAITESSLSEANHNLEVTQNRLSNSENEVTTVQESLDSANSTIWSYSDCVDLFGEWEYYQQGAYLGGNAKDLKKIYMCFYNTQSSTSTG